MSGGRLQQRLEHEWGSRLGLLFDGLLPGAGIGRELGPVSGLCTSQILGLHSLCTRSFNIIGGPWL